MKHTTRHPALGRSTCYRVPTARLFLLLSIGATAACSGPAKEPGLTDLRGVRGDPPGKSRAEPDRSRPAALINGQPLTWEEVSPSLAEAAGGVVLEELTLDRLVAAEYRSRFGKGPEDISNERLAAERQYLNDSIRRAGDLSSNEAAVLAADLRKNRGLGDARYTTLLRRTAMMRDLVAPNISITPEMIQQRYDVRFGPKYRAKILTTATEADAVAAAAEIQSGPCELSIRFATVAARISTDESKIRGGEIEPISPADPAYSPALRAALIKLQPGELSGVLALDPGFGIALLEEVIPARPTTLDEQRADIEDELRRRQERVQMDTMARGMLQTARVVVMDSSLNWAWKNRPSQPEP